MAERRQRRDVAGIATYTLTAQASDMLLLRAARTGRQLTPVVRLLDADGVVVCQGGTTYSAGAETTPCLMPRDGAYAVIVHDARGTQTGSIALYAQRLTNPVGATGIGPAARVVGSIAHGPDSATYALLAGRDTALQLQMATTGGQLRPAVRVYDGQGTPICQAASTWGASVEIPRCLLPRSGRYTVLAGDTSATQPGTYTLTLTCLTASCPAATGVPQSGGTVHVGPLVVTIPPGAFTTPISVTGVVLDQPSGAKTPLQQVALAAQGADGAPVTKAVAPTTYSLTVSAADLTAWGGRLDRLEVRIWDAAKGVWAAVPAEADAANSRLTLQSALLGDVAVVNMRRQVFVPLLVFWSSTSLHHTVSQVYAPPAGLPVITVPVPGVEALCRTVLGALGAHQREENAGRTRRHVCGYARDASAQGERAGVRRAPQVRSTRGTGLPRRM